MQDRVFPITARDIIANLPYVTGCHLAFGHHASKVLRLDGQSMPNYVIDA